MQLKRSDKSARCFYIDGNVLLNYSSFDAQSPSPEVRGQQPREGTDWVAEGFNVTGVSLRVESSAELPTNAQSAERDCKSKDACMEQQLGRFPRGQLEILDLRSRLFSLVVWRSGGLHVEKLTWGLVPLPSFPVRKHCTLVRRCFQPLSRVVRGSMCLRREKNVNEKSQQQQQQQPWPLAGCLCPESTALEELAAPFLYV